MNEIIIPKPLQIVVDDLGWFCPNDDRHKGGPSRTAMTRPHSAEDYKAINYLGQELGMKINCAFVIGEWDPDNRLASVKNLSKWDSWDNVSYINRAEIEKCVDAINSSEYIDIAVHGLMHGYYIPESDNCDVSDYYYFSHGRLFMISEDEVRHRLDRFFELLDFYKVNKSIDSFVPPSFRIRWGEISPILADYGIRYNSTIFKFLESDGELPDTVGIDNGIITLDRNNNLIPWDEVSTDFSALDVCTGIFGAHWPNLLHHNPERNYEVIDGAVRYFKKCADTFGTVLSRDMQFCATQSLFSKYATLDGVTVDLSHVPRVKGVSDTFTVSSRGEITTCQGGEILSCEKMDGFFNYELRYDKDVVTLI